MSVMRTPNTRVIGRTLHQKQACDDLLLVQCQGQRSRFRSLPSKIVKTFHIPTKCFHFLISCSRLKKRPAFKIFSGKVKIWAMLI